MYGYIQTKETQLSRAGVKYKIYVSSLLEFSDKYILIYIFLFIVKPQES